MATGKQRKGDHIRLLDNFKSVCLHCGQTYTPEMPASLTMITAIMKAFQKDHRGCTIRKEKGLACGFCLQFGHAEETCPGLKTGGDPKAWWRGPDTGISSKTICHYLAGRPSWAMLDSMFGERTPSDPSDFGRCHRLLHAIPGWRERIGEMASVPGWAGLVGAWDELERRYLEELPTGEAPKLWARMKELTAT